MNPSIRQPPNRTGYFKGDISRIYQYIAQSMANIKNTLMRLNDDNIVSLSASKLKGDIDLSATKLKGDIDLSNVSIISDCINITENGFQIRNESGTQYIELADGELTIKANIITE